MRVVSSNLHAFCSRMYILIYAVRHTVSVNSFLSVPVASVKELNSYNFTWGGELSYGNF